MPSPTVLLISYLVTITIVIALFFYVRRASTAATTKTAQPIKKTDDIEAQGPGRRRGAVDRLRRAQQQQQREEPVEEKELKREEGESGDEEEEEFKTEKEARKHAEKEARRHAREEQLRAREASDNAKKRKDDARAELRAKKDAERLAVEQAKAEEERKAAEEQAKKDAEEFDQWKDMFTVSAEGSAEAEMASESQGLLQEFIDYIKDRKVVVLDELASHFGLRTQDAVSRIQSLESSGMITGVLDDRGKFIYITQEELDAVAKYINKRGRVNISDLVAESNKLIDLTTRADAEAEKAAQQAAEEEKDAA